MAAFTRAVGWADDIKKKNDYTNDGEKPSSPDSARNISAPHFREMLVSFLIRDVPPLPPLRDIFIQHRNARATGRATLP